MTEKMENYSNLFHSPQKTYLLSHSVGLRPKSSETIDSFYKSWQQQGGDAWPAWLEIIDQFQTQLARLFNAKPKDFCPQTNITSGLCKILSGLDSDSPKNILLSESDFPSLAFAFKRYLPNANFIFINEDEDISNKSVWEHYLEEKIDIALITFCTSHSGKKAPISEISSLCKKHSILSILDIAHAAGIAPIEFSKIDYDFILGSCVKWLCAGPGAGFLWANPNSTFEITPKDVGWFSHENPFEFDIHHFKYASDAKKYWGATPNISPYAQACDSLKLINEIGIEAIYHHNKTLQHLFLDHHPNLVINNSLNDSGGTLILNIGPQSYEQLKQQCHIDICKSGVRLSPHIYNTSDEILSTCELISSLKL